MAPVRKTKDWELLVDRISQPFSPDELVVEHLPRREVPWNGRLLDTLAKMETERTRAVSEMIAAGRKVFDAPQFHLSNYEVRDGVLRIKLRPTDYFSAVLDNKAASMPEFQAEMMDAGEHAYGDVYALFGRVLAANSVIKLADGYFLQFRGPDVMDYRLAFHNVGGHPKKENRDGRGQVADWHGVMISQIANELGISKEEIESVELMGIAENTHTRKPDLLYTARVGLGISELAEGRGAEDWEQAGKYLVGNGEIREFLQKNQEKGKIHLPGETPPIARYMFERLIKMHGLDPTTSTNFCPVGEAGLALYLQMEGADLSDIYRDE